MGMRRAVLPIAETDDLGASLSLMSSQLEYAFWALTRSCSLERLAASSSAQATTSALGHAW